MSNRSLEGAFGAEEARNLRVSMTQKEMDICRENRIAFDEWLIVKGQEVQARMDADTRRLVRQYLEIPCEYAPPHRKGEQS